MASQSQPLDFSQYLANRPSVPDQPEVHPLLKKFLSDLSTSMEALHPQYAQAMQHQRELEAQQSAQEDQMNWRQYEHDVPSAFQQSEIKRAQDAQQAQQNQRQDELNQQNRQFGFQQMEAQQRAMQAAGSALTSGDFRPSQTLPFTIPGLQMGGVSSPSIPQGTPTEQGAIPYGGFGGQQVQFLSPNLQQIPSQVAKTLGLDPSTKVPIKELPNLIERAGQFQKNDPSQIAAQLAPRIQGASTHLGMLLGGTKDPVDQSYFQGLQSQLSHASTPAEIDKIEEEGQNYFKTNSRVALDRRVQENVASGVGLDEAKKDAESKRVQNMAPQIKQMMEDTGVPPTELVSRMSGELRLTLMNSLENLYKSEGKSMPEWLTSAGQKTLTEINNTQDIGRRALTTLNGMKDENGKPLSQSNTPFSQLPSRLQYALGSVNDKSSLINQLEVFKAIAAGRIASGAGIHTQEFVDWLKPHVPDVKKDSPAMIVKKLGDINNYLDIQAKNTHKNQNKWGMIRANGGEIPEEKNGTMTDEEVQKLKSILGGK